MTQALHPRTAYDKIMEVQIRIYKEGIMLQLGICDDDKHMLTYLTKLCSGILPEAGIEAFHNGMDLLNSSTEFDIILMDISMGKMNGLETIKQLRSRTPSRTPHRPAVIFITAYDEYVFDAFDLFAFQYLLKPLDEEKFEKILKMAAAECEEHTDEKALFFHTKTDHIRVCPSQIFYVESNLRKVVIHTEKEAFEIYATMNDLEKHLGSRFYRCHRGFLVNLEKINSYNRQTIRLTDGSSLLLSKTRYSEFVDTYMHFLKRGEL